MKYILHHLGLGDHIICNGLVRELVKDNLNYTLFVKEHNYDSVNFMYRDLTNVKLKIINEFPDAFKFFINNSIEKEKQLICGFTDFYGHFTWDQIFYVQKNIDFKYRWDKFYYNRDVEKENNLYLKLNPNNEKFILIHSMGSDGVDRINYDVIKSPYLKIFIKKGDTNIVFDYTKLIESAEEIHCVSSSFHLLIDSLPTNATLFIHDLKNKRSENNYQTKKMWTLI